MLTLNTFLSIREEPMYRVFEHSQVVLNGFRCMYAIHEASLQSHELFYIWTNLKIQLKPSMSEIRNYLVANPIYTGK